MCLCGHSQDVRPPIKGRGVYMCGWVEFHALAEAFWVSEIWLLKCLSSAFHTGCTSPAERTCWDALFTTLMLALIKISPSLSSRGEHNWSFDSSTTQLEWFWFTKADRLIPMSEPFVITKWKAKHLCNRFTWFMLLSLCICTSSKGMFTSIWYQITIIICRLCCQISCCINIIQIIIQLFVS